MKKSGSKACTSCSSAACWCMRLLSEGLIVDDAHLRDGGDLDVTDADVERCRRVSPAMEQ